MTDKRTDEFTNEADIACAFCGKRPHEVAAMIAGPNGIYICDECISVCAESLMRDMGMNVAGRRPHAGFDPDFIPAAAVEGEAAEPSPEDVLENLPTPHQLYDQLSEYVVGQEAAKRALS
ncbi:MAG: ClpX C4-type zinc finger protein, partial [Berryella intestinalis]|nr:ClpX C4-type zinc finger protein [Berryella intestinalis]